MLWFEVGGRVWKPAVVEKNEGKSVVRLNLIAGGAALVRWR